VITGNNAGDSQHQSYAGSVRAKGLIKPRSLGNISTTLPGVTTPVSSVGNDESPRNSHGGDSPSVDSTGNLISRPSNESNSVGLLIDDDTVSMDDPTSLRYSAMRLLSRDGSRAKVKKSLSMSNVATLISTAEEENLRLEESVELNTPMSTVDSGSSGKSKASIDRQFSSSKDKSEIGNAVTLAGERFQRDQTVMDSDVLLPSSSQPPTKKELPTPHPGPAATSSLTNLDPTKGKSPKALDNALNKSLSEAMWPVLRQQVFLGMSASSVPIRPAINDIFEDLTQAGVRFVYFSPRNMRRSQKVAEKIGLETDWNCAISLRALASDAEADPHRFISQYADWDVKAKLPHGIKAIKQHLKEVDNVPLLVSLFTDSTPTTITEMIEVFRDHGEVVMTLGSTYRSHNQAIYTHSDIAISVDMLPSELSQLSSSSAEVIAEYPMYHSSALSQADLCFLFRLVGLQTCAILQAPCPLPSEHSVPHGMTAASSMKPVKSRSSKSNPTLEEANPLYDGANKEGGPTPLDNKFLPSLDLLESVGAFGQSTETAKDREKDRDKPLNLRSLMEAIRTGRLFILNAQQCLGFLCVALCGTGLWSVYCQVVPLSVAPVMSPPMLLLFVCIYIPAITASILFSPAAAHSEHNVMKNTPRKNTLAIKPRDEARFWWYLLYRVAMTCLAGFVVGWLASSAPLLDSEESLDSSDVDLNFVQSRGWVERVTTWRDAKLDRRHGRAHYLHVQDVMSCQLLLSLVAHSMTLLNRGLTYSQLPINISKYRGHYACIFFCLVVHSAVLLLRMSGRVGGYERFAEADIYLWVAMCVFPLLEIVTGIRVNGSDDQMYKRYLQFLRLEFDTRLGMYSPR